MANGKYKTVLFWLLSAVMLLPMLQHSFAIYSSRPLGGAVTNAGDVAFSIEKWWSGEYQQAKNKYLNDNTGFRPELVRLNNELDYRLFGKLHARNVVMGRKGCLYEQGYIDEYTGLENVNDSILRTELVKLRRIQDTLQRLGKAVVFVEAASKAWYYPELFPSGIRNRRYRTATTYKKHIALCDSLGINHIDMNAWFAASRSAAGRNKLFTPGGVHWSVYGSLLAADSLGSYINRHNGPRMPRLKINRMAYSAVPQYTDDDIARGLNLMFPPPAGELCYPEYSFETGADSARPKVIFIGDSFVWTLMDNGYVQATGPEWEFWYYFSEVWKRAPDGNNVHSPLSGYNWQARLATANYIVAMFSTTNLKTFWDKNSFIEQMYGHYYPAPLTIY